MVNDKHLLINMHMVCAKQLNCDMKMVSSKHLSISNFNYNVQVVNYNMQVVNILLIMLHMPLWKICNIF